jgi:hypothetical protein
LDFDAESDRPGSNPPGRDEGNRDCPVHISEDGVLLRGDHDISYTLSLVLSEGNHRICVSVILVLFFIFLFNPPLHDMSYYYTNLVHENIRFFWGVLITMFIVSSGVQLNALREKSLL